MWTQLQIHIWVILFYLNFHFIHIMLTLCYLQNSAFCPITPFQVVRCEKNYFSNKGCFYFKMIILSTNNAMLSSRLNVLSHNSIPSGQIWNIPSQTGVVFFFKMISLSTNNPMLSSKLNVLSHNSVQSGQS